MINISIHGGILVGKRSYLNYLMVSKMLRIKSKKEIFDKGHLLIKYKIKLEKSFTWIDDNDIVIKLNGGCVWDYNELLNDILPDIDGLIFIYDLQKAAGSHRDGRDQWLHFEKVAPQYIGNIENYPIIYCYNFYDFFINKELNQSCYSPEEFNKMVNKYNYPWFATSCKTGENVKESFSKLLEMIMKRKAQGV